MAAKAVSVLTVVATLAVFCVGCREEPETPTTGESAYQVNWPVTRGRELYEQYCLSCHGTDGRRDGYNSDMLPVRPADLTDRTRMAELTDEALAGVIREGGPAAGLSVVMPAFGASLEEQEVEYLVAYLRALSGQPAAEAASTAQDGEEKGE